MIAKNIGIIGGGNMGEALIKGLQSNRQPRLRNLAVSDASLEKLKYLRHNYKVDVIISNKELAQRSQIILLAVKPNIIDTVLSEIAPIVDEKKVIISIAAGATTGRIEKKLFKKISVIRAMPNMPALIGKGISAVCFGRFARPNDKRLAINILSSVGSVVEVKEDVMDVVTAISGSGPAYFFFLIEMLIEIGIRYGLKAAVAKELAVGTAIGAGCLIFQTKQDAKLLRHKVTSKGGTTEAAFRIFKERGLDRILQDGIEAAIKRSRQICSY